MDKLTAIATSKQFRVDLDAILQRMKAFKADLVSSPAMDTPTEGPLFDDPEETVEQHKLSFRALQLAVMHQGMVLKYIGSGANPYPSSYDPKSPVVEPTADGLKM